MGTPRTSVPLRLLLPAIPLALAGAAALWAGGRPDAEPGRVLTAADPATEAVVLPDYGTPRAHGSAATWTTTDGSALPPGTRRTGPRRLLTPDGRVYERRRGESGWTLVPATDAGPREDTSGPGSHDAPKIPHPWGKRTPSPFGNGSPAPPVVGAVDGSSAGLRLVAMALDLRPATVPGAAGEPPAPKWAPAQETLTPRERRRPRLDTTRNPESARRDAVAPGTSPGDERAELDLVAQHGLRADYYDFLHGRLRSIPELEALPPSFTRIDVNVDFEKDSEFALPFEPETFATLWRGWLLVPEAGTYTFTAGSDDGVRLRIGEATVLEYTHLRAYGETDGTVELQAGRHPIELVFYENAVFAACRLFWQGPSWEKRIVAARYLTPPDDVADVIQPHVIGIEPSHARVEETVTLRGRGFAAAPPLNLVTFGGVPADVLEAEADRLLVRVPLGAATGDVTVQVGPLSSLPEPFEVTSVSGLFAEYFHVGADLHALPDFTKLTPYFVRLEGPLDFHQDMLWNLPYEPDVFAARYSGFLYFPEEDEYRVTLGSDDGVHMTLDGEDFVAAPGLHSYREVARTARFTKGFHPIEITFFENRGVARLRLFWERPGDAGRTVIPRGFLFPPEEVASRPTPTVSAIEPTAAPIDGKVTISGAGFGASARHVRVLFGGDVWVRPDSVTDERIVARVPYGAETGDLRVEAGIRRSAATRFTVSSEQGLTGDYYVFSSPEDLEQNATPEALALRSPNLTRVDRSFLFREEKDWKLPFPARNFAVHWHGSLGVEYPTRRLFLVQADDGAYLHLNGHRVVDCAPFHTLREGSGVTDLAPGKHAIDLFYFQRGDEAKLLLFWTPWGHHEHLEVPARWFLPLR